MSGRKVGSGSLLDLRTIGLQPLEGVGREFSRIEMTMVGIAKYRIDLIVRRNDHPSVFFSTVEDIESRGAVGLQRSPGVCEGLRFGGFSQGISVRVEILRRFLLRLLHTTRCSHHGGSHSQHE